MNCIHGEKHLTITYQFIYKGTYNSLKIMNSVANIIGLRLRMLLNIELRQSMHAINHWLHTYIICKCKHDRISRVFVELTFRFNNALASI